MEPCILVGCIEIWLPRVLGNETKTFSSVIAINVFLLVCYLVVHLNLQNIRRLLCQLLETKTDAQLPKLKSKLFPIKLNKYISNEL